MPSVTRSVRKAILPVAGMGTRFLPATKSVPKEIMTLVDRPLIQYAIDEARAAGIEDFIFVTARGKTALENYFDHAPHLEEALLKDGKTALLEALRKTDMESGAVAYIRQYRALGLGHAVWCARRFVGDEPFAVILPDDVISAEKPCLQQMVEAYEETGGAMMAAMKVAPDEISSYGVLGVDHQEGRLLHVNGMVEKPPRDQAPSDRAIIGRYILPPTIFESLNSGQKGANGEIQLTDAIAQEITAGRKVFGYEFDGRRFDCGSKIGFLRATVAFALERDEFRDDFSAFLRETAKEL